MALEGNGALLTALWIREPGKIRGCRGWKVSARVSRGLLISLFVTSPFLTREGKEASEWQGGREGGSRGVLEEREVGVVCGQ